VTGELTIQGNQVGFNNILLAPTSGNVGIGTAAVTARRPFARPPSLRVVKDTPNAAGATIEVQNTAGGDAAIDFLDASGNLVGNIGLFAERPPFFGRFVINQSVWGEAPALNTVLNEGGGNVGIGVIEPAHKLVVAGNVVATGFHGSHARTKSNGPRRLYAQEATEVRVVDEGRGTLVDGQARVDLDPIFMETIEGEYSVFLTAEGDNKGLHVAGKDTDHFIVKENQGGTSGISFVWMLTATRTGFKGVRLEAAEEIRTGAEALRQRAQEEIGQVTDPALRAELEALMEAEKWTELAQRLAALEEK
jgi:hypothetical protein